VTLAACALFLTETPQDLRQIEEWLISRFTNQKRLRLLRRVDTGLSRRKLEELLGIPTVESKGERYNIASYVHWLYRLSLVYDRDTVVAFSIMTRGRRFSPRIQISQDHTSVLGKTTFAEFLPSHLSVAQWEVSTVPKDIMYYETSYLGNAKDYETCLLGYSCALSASGRYVVAFSGLHVLGEVPKDVEFDLNRALIYAACSCDDDGMFVRQESAVEIRSKHLLHRFGNTLTYRDLVKSIDSRICGMGYLGANNRG